MGPELLSFLGLAALLSHSTVNGAAVKSRDQPMPNATTTLSTGSWSFSTFTYPSPTPNRYATPLVSPLAIPTKFAPPFSQASTLLDANITYTTYSLNPTATTASNDGQYGQGAFARLWANASLSYRDQPPFTTTVSPTPVPSSELVFPSPLPVQPLGQSETANMRLPSDFVWGVASSAWQIEGGLQVEGRGPSVDDSIGALPSTANDSNVNAMFYYLYKQDVERLAAVGIPYFCFSIPWTRIVPFGVAGSPINQQALDHYDDLINYSIAKGITPIITILHYDLPLAVPYSDPAFSRHFLYYAKQLMTRWGDRVPYWVTVNEPNLQPVDNALTNILIAHADLYDWYKNDLQGKGKITLKFANNLAVPLDPDNADDVAAALRYQDFLLGIMANPLFLGKQIPETVLKTAGIKIDPISSKNLALISGKIDFFSIDPYSAQYVTAPKGGVSACAADPNNPLWPTCVETTNVASNGWLIGDASYVPFCFVAPQYVRYQLGYVWNTFKPKGGILVAEFGFPAMGDTYKDLDGQRYDLERTCYYQAFLNEVLKAVHEDGVRVVGTLAWSFIDTNEFGTFEARFGLQTVNHTTFERTYKRSVFDYVDFFHQHVSQ
ncbi:beta-glucosidase [Diplogelasinospora grovesii]|uniref:Beta-glucosidase n=1 Tax=Diplogelasinospora grovesii TaxID=303347 RepID=A0AAN6RZW0_9PEZI|nr:beta-glucosidase [Diplogelasinospora grovesii]